MTQRFGNGQNIWEIAQIHGARIKYLRIGFLCWEWLQNLTIGLNMCEMTNVCGKWLKYLRNGKNMWEITQTCGKWQKYV